MPYNKLLQTHTGDAAARIKKTGLFTVDDIDLISRIYAKFDTAQGTLWDDFRNAHMILPSWFRMDLDPLSDQYLEQQKQLWKVLAGISRDYDPHEDEQTDDPRLDPVRLPAYFRGRGDQAVQIAADQVIATGMIMKHCGLKPGDWALEYGAGFGQTALTLARMGVNVDTVDISPTFCGYVKEQAEFFRVNLSSFKGKFGFNPRGDHKYDLIFFYESFHHCLDFKNVIRTIKNYLTPTGRVLLAGEPIVPQENLAVPYPWGLRLESENIAIIRYRRWFELGFSEDFIADVFTNSGFTVAKIDCHISSYGKTWVFSQRNKRISLSSHWMPNRDASTWHGPDPMGRWTTSRSCLTLDCTDSFNALEICATNYHPIPQILTVTYGDKKTVMSFNPGRQIMRIDATFKSPNIIFESETFIPADYKFDPRISGTMGMLKKYFAKPFAIKSGSNDRRALGMHIEYIDYL